MPNTDNKPFKNPLGFRVSPEIIPYLRGIPSDLAEEFLDAFEVHESLKIRGCQHDEDRHKVECRTLLVGELRNFFKSLHNH